MSLNRFEKGALTVFVTAGFGSFASYWSAYRADWVSADATQGFPQAYENNDQLAMADMLNAQEAELANVDLWMYAGHGLAVVTALAAFAFACSIISRASKAQGA